jgi:hypothetical protein
MLSWAFAALEPAVSLDLPRLPSDHPYLSSAHSLLYTPLSLPPPLPSSSDMSRPASPGLGRPASRQSSFSNIKAEYENGEGSSPHRSAEDEANERLLASGRTIAGGVSTGGKSSQDAVGNPGEFG